MPKNPYAEDLGNQDALQAMASTPQKIRTLVQKWDAERLERSYAPGKWSARQVLIHLAQTEIALSYRLRMALSQQNYSAQNFEQDDWLAVDAAADAHTALDVYTAIRRLNMAMFTRLTPADLDRPFSHPEYGTLNVRWVSEQLGGHDIHHLKQLEQIR